MEKQMVVPTPNRLGLGVNPKIWAEPKMFKPERHFAGHVGNSTDVTLMEPEMRFVIFSTGLRGCAADSNLFMAKPLFACAKPRLAPTLYPKIQI
ncbi:hypothetical protein F2Q68_00011593 [Brassica cretica]|uniref:Uncharacterized protein n=1 Tax=Brassica cretica TaxID=69181 RepID=A0A8S9KTZ3_BRACR|nr:hypothetical protein F2Q68_00011593 [Brassica cretica]